jgi:hypothetical protein
MSFHTLSKRFSYRQLRTLQQKTGGTQIALHPSASRVIETRPPQKAAATQLGRARLRLGANGKRVQRS